MGLQFFHSYFLWGAGLFLLPVLIHLLRRRRIKVVRLPTYEFLLRTQRRIARKSQLKNWLLLALRISAVSLVVFLAARPLLSGEGWAGGSYWSPLHLTVVIDNSASMAYRTGRGTRLELAKRAARHLIEDLSSHDKASVLATAGGAAASLRGEGKEASLARLATIRQTDSAGDAAAGVVRRVLEGTTDRVDRRSLVVLSDFAKSDWEGLRIRGLRRVSPHLRVQFVRVAHEAGTDDVVLRSIRRRPWPPQANSPFAVVAAVANLGKKEQKKVSVSLYLGEEKTGYAELELRAREEKEVSFRVLAPGEGALRGRIELGPDSLDVTNRRYFSAEMGRRSRALIIDGNPRRGLVDSESFY
ncbi:BatA domain-containing protein, partial [Nitrospinota bacterium]